MAVLDGSEPIDDDEIVFRRVSDKSGWYDPNSDRPVAWLAFRPNERDTGGLSVWRAKYKTAAEAASVAARAGRQYYVLAMEVGQLRRARVVVQPTPKEGGAGHASLVNLSGAEYARDPAGLRELAEYVASNLVKSVHGPLGPFDQ